MKNEKTRTAETRWWWVRHAPVADNVRIYGQNDVASDCSNAEVFGALARELPRGAVWLTTNLGRTKETAAAIVAAMDEGVRPQERAMSIPAFAEQHLGDWQGLAREEFYKTRRSFPFWFGPADERAPGGESFNDLIARVRPAVERLTRHFAGRDIVAVAHGGTIKAMLAISLGLPPRSRAFLYGRQLLDHARRSSDVERRRVLADRGGQSPAVVAGRRGGTSGSRLTFSESRTGPQRPCRRRRTS